MSPPTSVNNLYNNINVSKWNVIPNIKKTLYVNLIISHVKQVGNLFLVVFILYLTCI